MVLIVTTYNAYWSRSVITKL